MDATRENRMSRIVDEIGRGSSLDHALDLIAEQLATDIGAPTCKIWVVKRGDICERCPLASICTNRDMCMHLMATSGASLEREYPRIPVSLLTAPWISRGGTSDFSDPRGAGDKLFGLQRSTPIRSQDSFALFPLRGSSGTVGLIGVFNHRPFRLEELEAIEDYAPAAVAAVRVAELQSRCESLRARLQKEALNAQSTEPVGGRQNELEEGVAQLTHDVAQLRVERDAMAKATEEAKRFIAQLESQNSQLQSQIRQNATVPSAERDIEIRKTREENDKLKERVKALESNLGDANRMRENLMGELAERNLEAKQLNTRLLRLQSRLSTAEEESAALTQRLLGLEQSHALLEGEKSTFIDSVNHLERSLQIAEDARARFEQASVVLEERVSGLTRELERLRVENNRILGENEQLVTEADNLSRERSEERKKAEALAMENAQLDAAAKQVQSLAARLEETAGKLQRKVEASDASRAELEQRILVLTEQNRRLGIEGQSRAKFLASMSHELRTPMNAIIGFTSLLLEDRDLQLSERHRSSLERVSRNARELLELINNVLDLSKIEAGRMDVFSEPADLRMLIERAVGVAEPLREGRPIELAVDVENGLPAMRTDRTKLQQALINLLSNALKFTNQGKVTVTARQSGTEKVSISVSDTGVGIAEGDLPRLFEEFRQVGKAGRGERTGTGLGLAITKKLVELISGQIEVASRLGEGSTFTIELPIEIEGRAAPEPDAESPLTDPERTALVIDSDPASLFLTKKYFADAGYSVVATDDAERGVEIARVAKPSVITVDLDSIENGVQVIKSIGRLEKGRLLIAISADAACEHEVFEKGASVFLRKPVERALLVGLINQRHAPIGTNVLVVDDDPDARELVVAMIGDSGCQIQTASNGREALEQIARVRPDAIILDLMLPEMDGFEVIHRMSLNPQWRSIPVILLTARDLSHEERRALDLGTARVIQKGTFTRDELVAELGVIMAREPEQTPVAVQN
jgi:signal transduction histidine kinase/CheY-like chemotaxis protein